MKITRQLLFPTLLWFAILAIALLSFAYFNNTNTNRQMETEQLEQMESILRSRLAANQDFALALALEVANDPEVQRAFAQQDRARLMELTLPAYQVLDSMYGLPQAQFHLPPAISFLRLHALDTYGDDLSSFRFTVLEANEQRKPVAGLEIGRGGLGMRGVAPVSYQGQHVGSFEYGLNLDKVFLNDLKAEFGVDAQILLRRGSAEIATIEESIRNSVGPSEDWLLQASTLEQPIFGPAEGYGSILQNRRTIASLRQGTSQLAVLTLPLTDYSGQVIGAIDLIADRSASLQALNRRVVVIIGMLSALLAMGGIGFSHLVRRVMRPIAELTSTAGAIAAGDLSQTAEVRDANELGQLAQAFNSMTAQLRVLVGNLERRVDERTAALEQRTLQLQTAAQVARDTLAVRDLDQLLDLVVNLVREKFGFYHAGIFLVDQDRKYAVLKAATGEAGREMLSHHHRLEIGKSGIVGYVTGAGKARIALDVGDDAVHFQNPALPNTRSEMALPLIVGEEIIGALDVQSTEAAAFSEQDIEILQILADQTAVAIANARLFAQNQAALETARRVYTELSQLAWQERLQSHTLGYLADGTGVQALGAESHPARDVSQLEELQLPIVVRDQVIGSIAAHKRAESGNWNAQELILMQTLAEELSQALESARLFEETQERALRERLVGEITSRMRSTLEIETVMQTAVREILQVLKLAEVELRLGAPNDASPAAAGKPEPHLVEQFQ
jgi:GAF domain-containing protein/HAMP domain-containing protein